MEPSNLFDPKIASWVVEPELDKQNYEFPELVFFFMRKILNIPDLNSQHIHKDLVLCDELADHIKGLLQQQQLMSAFYHEMTVVPIMARMEIEGIGFDKLFLQQYRQSLLVGQISTLCGTSFMADCLARTGWMSYNGKPRR